MSNPDIIRVRHMLDAAQEALSFVGDKSRSELRFAAIESR